MEPIKKLFEKDFFSDLLEKKIEIDLFQQIVNNILPKNMVNLCKVSKLSKNTLYIYAPSNGFAHKIKLMSKNIIKDVNASLDKDKHITSLKVRVKVADKIIPKHGEGISIKGIAKLSDLSKKLSVSPLKKTLFSILKK